jgi:hypothetical protein
VFPIQKIIIARVISIFCIFFSCSVPAYSQWSWFHEKLFFLKKTSCVFHVVDCIGILYAFYKCILILSSWYSRGSLQGIHLCSFDPSLRIRNVNYKTTNWTRGNNYKRNRTKPAYKVGPCLENGRRKITLNSIEVNGETKESTRETEVKLDGRYKEGHKRKKLKWMPVGR